MAAVPAVAAAAVAAAAGSPTGLATLTLTLATQSFYWLHIGTQRYQPARG